MTQSGPVISVVVTCYNYGRYVGHALESALAQTYSNVEIIVVDDGSTDDSAEVIGRYADRVRVITQENRGSIAAYNAGFSASRGDIVILLDADDLLHPRAAERVARVWTPSCAKVQYDLAIIDAEANDLGRRFCNFTPDYDAERVRSSFAATGTYRWPVTVGNAYTRAFAEKLFPLQVQHGPDGTLNTLAPLYGDVITIPAVLGSYRLHGSNAWSSNGTDHGRLPQRIRDRMQEVSAMRVKAGELGVLLPPSNVLDHELPFINYRLMAWKLGLDYPNKAEDSPRALLAHAVAVIRKERLSAQMSLAHAAWFAALTLAPRPVAKRLIQVRFERGAIRQSVRRRLGAVLGREAA